jgi:hypothetical protein
MLTAGLLFASVFNTFATEGIRLSVQNRNVVLSWPSSASETYIVQYRQTLDAAESWQTLTNYYPAFTGTNQTTFVHSNQVSFSASIGESSIGDPLLATAALESFVPAVPMVMPANGSGDALPLAIYPPGFDLSSYIIFDPITGELVNGSEFIMSSLSPEDPQPLGGGSGGGPVLVPETGFYRVVRDGVHLFGITNGITLSGEILVPIEYALDNTDEIAGVTFYANGSPLIGASATSTGGGWMLDWNTRMMPNGSYNVTAEIDFVTDNPVTSTPATVTVTNTISFPNYFSRMFGSQMWIYAVTIPNVICQIDMYDENTNYLGFFQDYADGNGVISFLWDLTDGNGHTFNSTNFYGVFTVDTSSLIVLQAVRNNLQMTNSGSPTFTKIAKTVSTSGRITPNDGGSSASALQTWASEWNWSGNDNFVIAYAPLNTFGTTTEKINLMVANGVVDVLYNGYTINPENKPLAETAFGIYGASEKSSLMAHLGDPGFRNFYYFGHGSPYAIGGVGAGTVTTYTDIAHTLNNFFITSKPANVHPYRFVFIDGCSAGEASFCEAFGIPAQTLNNAFFANAGVRSRAFIGFKTQTDFNPQQWQQRANMLVNFWTEWVIYGYNLQTCVNDGVNYGSGGLDSSVVIYGAANLQRNSP